jgi:hypothetical protein
LNIISDKVRWGGEFRTGARKKREKFLPQMNSNEVSFLRTGILAPVRAGLFRLLNLFFLVTVAGVPLKSSLAAGLAGAEATDVTVSEYNPKDFSLAVQLHAATIFIDYERWGFFRIGLLPLLVARDVQIKVQSASYLANALADLRASHQTAAGVRRLEMRNLEIAMVGENQPRLRAAVARFGQDGSLKLSAVTVHDIAGRQIYISRAAMRLSGPSTGWLQWNSGGGPHELFTFQTNIIKTP